MNTPDNNLQITTITNNNFNIEWIKSKLSNQRRHLHTMIDAIDSYIEYNNIQNYTILI